MTSDGCREYRGWGKRRSHFALFELELSEWILDHVVLHIANWMPMAGEFSTNLRAVISPSIVMGSFENALPASGAVASGG